VAIRPPKHHSQGYTLLEMLAVVGMASVIMAFAVPSLLALNKPLRDGTLQFKSHLSLVRSKAISSNQAYRIKPRYPTSAQYILNNSIPNSFIVEYAANCQTAPANWRVASQLDLDLPASVGISDLNTTFTSPSISVPSSLSWNICFDNRGTVDINSSATKVVLKDFRGDNIAKVSLFDISLVGNADITTHDSNTSSSPNPIPLDSQGNPVF
jgi:prepilin-type N-terminal cleavage/methylation domain-containing protein